MIQAQYHFIKTACGVCKRPLLIEQWINGSNHTIGITVVCADCIVLPFLASFEKEHQKEAAEIRKWIDDCKPKVWCIGPDETEYYAARSETEMKEYYISLVGEQQAKDDFEDHFELVPESKMDAEFDFHPENGDVTQTTWRKLLRDAILPSQVSSGYC